MAKSFLYLVAVIDWHSRKVVARRPSNTMEADLCVEALREAIAVHGTPEILTRVRAPNFGGT
jgi:putative transposase